MTKFFTADVNRVVVSLVAALLFSTTCVVGAVGPARAAEAPGATGALTF